MKRTLALALTGMAVFAANFVAGAPVQADDFKLAMVIKSTTNPYYNATLAGAKIAAQELGGSVENDGPTQSSATAQVDIINNLADRHISAIAVAPSDPDAVAPAMKRAQKLGVKVITFDADSAWDARPFHVNMATTDSVGRYGAKRLAQELGNKGKVAIVSAQATAANQNAWIKAFRDELKKPEYAGIEVVDEVYGNDNEQQAFDATVALTTKYPDLAGIYAPTCPGTSGGGAGAGIGRQRTRQDQARWNVRSEHHLEVHARRHDSGLLSVGSGQARLRHFLRGEAPLGGQAEG